MQLLRKGMGLVQKNKIRESAIEKASKANAPVLGWGWLPPYTVVKLRGGEKSSGNNKKKKIRWKKRIKTGLHLRPKSLRVPRKATLSRMKFPTGEKRG